VNACVYDLSKYKNVPNALRQAMLNARIATPARDLRAVRLQQNAARLAEVVGN